MIKPNIYCIPGLGFDRRIFSKLSFPDYNLVYIDWIEPLPRETIESYAHRMSKEINPSNAIIMGHSFGGVIGQEIAKQLSIHHLILVSSLKLSDELPLNLKLISPLRLSFLLSKSIILSTFPFWARSYGYTSKEDRILFRSMISKQSNHYLKWAIKTLSGWKHSSIPSEITICQIHGTRDKTLPYSKIKGPKHPIQGGGHFMIFQEAQKIETIVNNFIAQKFL